jgi:hypothetical protein
VVHGFVRLDGRPVKVLVGPDPQHITVEVQPLQPRK